MILISWKFEGNIFCQTKFLEYKDHTPFVWAEKMDLYYLVYYAICKVCFVFLICFAIY